MESERERVTDFNLPRPDREPDPASSLDAGATPGFPQGLSPSGSVPSQLSGHTPPPPLRQQGVQADDELVHQSIASAKLITERNAQDPYQQGEALQQLKADYISKRFHREIKPIEGS